MVTIVQRRSFPIAQTWTWYRPFTATKHREIAILEEKQHREKHKSSAGVKSSNRNKSISFRSKKMHGSTKRKNEQVPKRGRVATNQDAKIMVWQSARFGSEGRAKILIRCSWMTPLAEAGGAGGPLRMRVRSFKNFNSPNSRNLKNCKNGIPG